MPEQLRPESKDLGEAATFIPNSSFLIPNSRKAFIHNQWTEPPKGLTLNKKAADKPLLFWHIYFLFLFFFDGIVLQSIVSFFARADLHRIVDGGDEDLAIAILAG